MIVTVGLRGLRRIISLLTLFPQLFIFSQQTDQRLEGAVGSGITNPGLSE